MLTLHSKAGDGTSECSQVVSPTPRVFPRGQGLESVCWALAKRAFCMPLAHFAAPPLLQVVLLPLYPMDRRHHGTLAP